MDKTRSGFNGNRLPRLACAAALLVLVASCGRMPRNQDEEGCPGGASSCSEADINAPVPQPPSGAGATEAPASPVSPQGEPTALRFPDFNPAWGLKRAIYERAISYHQANFAALGNPRYVTVVDFNRPSSQKRLFIFDLATSQVEAHLVAHGAGSDPKATGYATLFSNVNNSKMSSLGFYLTLDTYQGVHGYSLHLKGLEATDSNAEERAIVMHPADYVQESQGHAGRSWGCPALDPKVSKGVIDRVRNGSLLLIAR